MFADLFIILSFSLNLASTCRFFRLSKFPLIKTPIQVEDNLAFPALTYAHMLSDAKVKLC